MKRTNKGNEGMTIEEIRATFMGYYEKRLKLELLRAELRLVEELARVNIVPESARSAAFTPFEFGIQIIESVVADTYSMTAANRALHRALNTIRYVSRVANNETRAMMGIVHLPLTDLSTRLEHYNTTAAGRFAQIAHECRVALSELNSILDPVLPATVATPQS